MLVNERQPFIVSSFEFTVGYINCCDNFDFNNALVNVEVNIK